MENEYLQKIKDSAIKFVVLVIILFFLLYLGFKGEGDKLGVIGDYFGGMLNPVFGFLSLLALLYTINIQLKALKIQSEELKLTREELEATREELARSSKAQEQSSAIFKQQQFETTFFSMLGHLDLSISETFKFEKQQVNQFTLNKLAIVYQTYDEFISSEKIEDIIREINSHIVQMRKDYISRFYSLITLIHEILYFIDRSSSSQEMYVNLLKSKLNQDILQILFISFLSQENEYFLEGKSLIEKYSVFDRINFFSSTSREKLIFPFYLLKDKYSENAFLNNSSFEKIPAENEFSEFKRAYYNHAN